MVRAAHRPGHLDRLGQVARVLAARPVDRARRRRRARLDPGRIESVTRRAHDPLPVPDQGAGRRPARRRSTACSSPAGTPGRPRRDVRRRHRRSSERRWVQEHADVVLTNPDFLHFALLPQHRRWARLLGSLRYVVRRRVPRVPRGVRRARRRSCCDGCAGSPRSYGATPDVPARVRDDVRPGRERGPAASASTRPRSSPSTDDTSPAGRKTFVLWQPPELPGTRRRGPRSARGRPVGDPAGAAAARDPRAGRPEPAAPDDVWDGAGRADRGRWRPGDARRRCEGSGPLGTGERVVAEPSDRPRRTATAEIADLLADLTAAGARTLAFTRSRRGAESVAATTRDAPARDRPDARRRRSRPTAAATCPRSVARSRRAIRSGALRALATTNALELGVDISGLDAVLIAGWPGTRVSLWQQAGRAGRAGHRRARRPGRPRGPARHVPGAPPRGDLRHPRRGDRLRHRRTPTCSAPHLCAAAAELPLRAEDARPVRPAHRRAAGRRWSSAGTLRRRPSGWYWTHNEPASRPDRPARLRR